MTSTSFYLLSHICVWISYILYFRKKYRSDQDQAIAFTGIKPPGSWLLIMFTFSGRAPIGQINAGACRHAIFLLGSQKLWGWAISISRLHFEGTTNEHTDSIAVKWSDIVLNSIEFQMTSCIVTWPVISKIKPYSTKTAGLFIYNCTCPEQSDHSHTKMYHQHALWLMHWKANRIVLWLW